MWDLTALKTASQKRVALLVADIGEVLAGHPDQQVSGLLLGQGGYFRVRHGGLLPVLFLDPFGQVRLPQLRDLSGYC